jgi:hypothetical protein
MAECGGLYLDMNKMYVDVKIIPISNGREPTTFIAIVTVTQEHVGLIIIKPRMSSRNIRHCRKYVYT